jgi:hypothetical protein
MAKDEELRLKTIESVLYATAVTWNLIREASYQEMRELMHGKNLTEKQ